MKQGEEERSSAVRPARFVTSWCIVGSNLRFWRLIRLKRYRQNKATVVSYVRHLEFLTAVYRNCHVGQSRSVQPFNIMKVLALSILAALFAEVTAFGPTLPLVSTQCARRKPQFAMGRPAQVLLCMNCDGDSEEDENSEEEVVDWEYVYEEVEEEVYEYESDPDAPVGIPLRDVDWDQAWVHFKIMRTYESHAFAKNAGTIVAALAFLATVHFCECSSATFLSSYHTHFRMDTSSRHLCSDRARPYRPSPHRRPRQAGGIVVRRQRRPFHV